MQDIPQYVTLHPELLQGTEEWFAARCGILTASEMEKIITPAKLQYASNDKSRSHLFNLAAQRVTKYVEPSYQGFDMIRGHAEEIEARKKYIEECAPVQVVGFITNTRHGFTLGYSPDGLVGDDGQIECKSRLQKYQMETLFAGEMPSEFMIQVQTGLLVSERKWCDFISYCGGMPMVIYRVKADPAVQEKILEAATKFHAELDNVLKVFDDRTKEPGARIYPTERTVAEEIEGGDCGMNDLANTVAAKSDQLNADDLIGVDYIDIEITGVRVAEDVAEQPVSISYKGDGGKPYKPGLSMRRVLLQAWGSKGSAYVGRRLRLYRDPEVTFGKLKVGGIRISHMSDIPGVMSFALTATRGSKKAFTVKPMPAAPQTGATTSRGSAGDGLIAKGREEAKKGLDALKAWWGGLGGENQRLVGGVPFLDELKAIASKVGEPSIEEGDPSGIPFDEEENAKL